MSGEYEAEIEKQEANVEAATFTLELSDYYGGMERPMEFGAVVKIIDPPPTIRPGLRAKVRIFFESKPNVLQVPLAAVIEHGDRIYCLVREQETWRSPLIRLGSNNNTHVVVQEGLAEGDQVALTPFQHKMDFRLVARGKRELVVQLERSPSSGAA